MKRLFNVVAICFAMIVFALGVGWVTWNIATADALTWFAAPASTVLAGAVIIAGWLLAMVLPLRWWLRARSRMAGA